MLQRCLRVPYLPLSDPGLFTRTQRSHDLCAYNPRLWESIFPVQRSRSTPSTNTSLNARGRVPIIEKAATRELTTSF